MLRESGPMRVRIFLLIILCIFFALIFVLPSSSLLSSQPQEALEDSPQVSAGLTLNEGDFCADSVGLCTSNEFLDLHSWDRDATSDLSPDGEDSFDALWRHENSCRQATCRSFFAEQSKTRRREAAKERDVTDTGRSSCNRRKSPDNQLVPNISFKLSTREQCSVELQTHPSTEKINLNLNQGQSSLQAACSDTQVKASTEPYSLHAQSQHNTDTFDTEVISSPYTPEVTHHAQLGESNHNRLTESTQSETIKVCNVQDAEAQNINTFYVDKNKDVSSCKSDLTNRHQRQRRRLENLDVINEDKEIQSVNSHSKGNRGCGVVGTIINGKHNNCIDDSKFTDVILAQKSDSICAPACPQVITEIVVASPNITNVHDTKTNTESHETQSELRDAIKLNVLAKSVDICCSHTQCEEIPNRRLSESHSQVCNSETTPQIRGPGVCFEVEQCECVGTTTKGSKPAGTVNEIHSSITFSTETFPLDTSDTELAVVSSLLSPASLDPLRDSDRAELSGRRLDQKHLPSERLQEWQSLGKTQDLIFNQLDQGFATVERPFQKQLCSVDKLLQKEQTTQIQSDTGKGSEECLTHNPLSNHLLFLSANQATEDTSHLLPENCSGHRVRVGSPISLFQQNKELELGGSHGYPDWKQTVEAESEASLPQLQLGTIELSEHCDQRFTPKPISDLDLFAQRVRTEIENTSTSTAESIQKSRHEHPEVAQKGISVANKQSAVSTISSNSKQAQKDLQISATHFGLQTSPLLLSDSNNNTQVNIKQNHTGEVIGCLSGGAQSSFRHNDKIICSLNKPPPNVTLEFLDNVEKSEKKLDLSLSSVDHKPKWSGGDLGCLLGKDSGRLCHVGLGQVNDLEKLRNDNCRCIDADNRVVECLGRLSESLEELDEDCRAHTQVSFPSLQQEVTVVRYSHPDVSLNRLGIRSLEPIREAEGSLENCGTTDDLILEPKEESDIMRPAEGVREAVILSGDHTSLKSSHLQSEQKEDSLIASKLDVDVNPATPILRKCSEKQCRPLTVAYDAVSYTSDNSNCDEMEGPQFDISDTNSNLNKRMKKSKTKGNQTGNKGSKFSVFAKMPSFRKAKGSKSSRGEDLPQELLDRGGESLLSEQGRQKDNSDDEVFLKGDIQNQKVHQNISPGHNEIQDEDCGSFPSFSLTCDGSTEVGSRGSSSDIALLGQAQSSNGQNYKRSKSNDSLKIPWKKSLSSLFESRSMDKENEEHGIDVDSGKVKQSWRKLKKAKEAELLKRALSVPDGECSNTSSMQDHRDCTSSLLLDRLSNPGSPPFFRTFNLTDPMPKRGVPQWSDRENPHGCKSEGQKRKGSPNGLPRTLSMSGLPSVLDCPGIPLCSHVSPLPSWTRSYRVPSDGLTESPLRPMSPKPNSPRPAAQRKVFRYPSSSRTSPVCSPHLGQSVSVEGLTDPPERPKTLKPSCSPLGFSISPLDAAEGRKDSQSHISLYAIGFMNELEVRNNQFVVVRADVCVLNVFLKLYRQTNRCSGSLKMP